MIFEIGGREFTFKYNVRTLILFEHTANKTFSLEHLTDWAMMAYSAMLSGTPEADMDFEEFLEIDPAELSGPIAWLAKQMKIEEQLRQPVDEDDGELKKK